MPIPEGREIGRRVAVAAVLLANDERERVAGLPFEARGEDAERAVALLNEAFLLELGDDVREPRVVQALAGDVRVRELDAELPVDGAEIPERLRDELPPERERFGVSPLEEHDARACALREGWIRLELRPRSLVERVPIADRERAGS